MTLLVPPVPHIIADDGTKYSVPSCSQLKPVSVPVISCHICLTSLHERLSSRVEDKDFARISMIAKVFKVFADLVDYWIGGWEIFWTRDNDTDDDF